MSITYPPELLPSPDEGQGADVWVHCTCGCAWDPTMLASCPVCDPKEITDSKDAEITKLTSQLEDARAALREIVEAKMPGEARSIARSALEAINKGGK